MDVIAAFWITVNVSLKGEPLLTALEHLAKTHGRSERQEPTEEHVKACYNVHRCLVTGIKIELLRDGTFRVAEDQLKG